ncbi:hypothetical protein KDA23_04335 [Candidatus Saccharibacteria bacterium]|nr:hypothetical protein [Candidatus Saccharibacteria bacterium]
MKNLLKRLKITNQRGMTHAMLLVALVVASGVGYVGYRVTTQSGAAVSPATVCGSGYVVRNSKVLSNNTKVHATAYLLVNKSAKKICGLTVSTGKYYGVSRYLEVHTSFTKTTSGSNPVRYHDDAGSYKYYAGPVYSSYDGITDNLYAHVWATAGTGATASTQAGYATMNNKISNL